MALRATCNSRVMSSGVGGYSVKTFCKHSVLSRDLSTKLLMPRLPEKQQTTRGDDYTYTSTAMDVQTVDLVYQK